MKTKAFSYCTVCDVGLGVIFVPYFHIPRPTLCVVISTLIYTSYWLQTGEHSAWVDRSTRSASWRFNFHWHLAGLAIRPLRSSTRWIILHRRSTIGQWRQWCARSAYSSEWQWTVRRRICCCCRGHPAETVTPDHVGICTETGPFARNRVPRMSGIYRPERRQMAADW